MLFSETVMDRLKWDYICLGKAQIVLLAFLQENSTLRSLLFIIGGH